MPENTLASIAYEFASLESELRALSSEAGIWGLLTTIMWLTAPALSLMFIPRTESTRRLRKIIMVGSVLWVPIIFFVRLAPGFGTSRLAFHMGEELGIYGSLAIVTFLLLAASFRLYLETTKTK